MIAIRSPEEIVNERRRKAKSKGKQLNKYEPELLAWYTLIITIPCIKIFTFHLKELQSIVYMINASVK